MAHHRAKAAHYRQHGHVPKAIKHDAKVDTLSLQLTCVWRVLQEVAEVSNRSLRLRTFYPKAATTIAHTILAPSSPQQPSTSASAPSTPLALVAHPLSPPSTLSVNSPSSHLAVPPPEPPQRRLTLNTSPPTSPHSASEAPSPHSSHPSSDPSSPLIIPSNVLAAVQSLRLLPTPPLLQPSLFPPSAASSFRFLHTLGTPPASTLHPSTAAVVLGAERLGKRRLSAVNMGSEVSGVDVHRLDVWLDRGEEKKGEEALTAVARIGNGDIRSPSVLSRITSLAVPHRQRAHSSSSSLARSTSLTVSSGAGAQLLSEDEEADDGLGDDDDDVELSLSRGSTSESAWSELEDEDEELSPQDEPDFGEPKEKGGHLSLLQRLTLSGVFRGSS